MQSSSAEPHVAPPICQQGPRTAAPRKGKPKTAPKCEITQPAGQVANVPAAITVTTPINVGSCTSVPPPHSPAGEMLAASGEFAKGVGNLLWPVVVVILVLAFRRELGRLIERIKTGKFLGTEFEFSDVVKELRDKVTEFEGQGTSPSKEGTIVAETPLNPARIHFTGIAAEKGAATALTEQTVAAVKSAPRKTDEGDAISTAKLMEEVSAVLEYSPKAAIVLLARSIESEIRDIFDILSDSPTPSRLVASNIRFLQNKGILPKELAEAISLFWKTRNVAVHAHKAISTEDTRDALNSGIEILSSLLQIERKLLGLPEKAEP